MLKAQGRMTGGRVVESAAERRSLWRVREDGAGLAARLVDGGESWPGWEDSAVAPENLAGYLRDFRKLLASHGLTGVLYGHFGAGCVHVRIDFDLAHGRRPDRRPPLPPRGGRAGRRARRHAVRRARRRAGAR